MNSPSPFKYLLLASSLLCAESSFSAEYKTEYKTEVNVNLGDDKTRVEISPEIEVDLNSGFKLTSLIKLSHESRDGLKPNQLNRDNYAPLSQPLSLGDGAELELRELYIEKAIGEAYLTLGKQQVVWGKADGLKLLDVVNPQSFREFILEDYEESRIPLWTINLELPVGENSDVQILWIPDTTTHVLPERDATFAFTSSRLTPSVPEGVSVRLSDIEAPTATLENSDVGLRWSGFVKGWDLSANYLYHFDDLPVFFQNVQQSVSGPEIVITPEYERTHLLGGSLSNTFGNITFRGEVAYNTDRYFFNNSGVVEHDEFSYVFGLDWYGLNETLVSLQLFQSHIVDARRPLNRPVTDTTLTLLLQKEWFNNTLKVEVLTLHNFHEGDRLFRPKIRYDWSDNLIVHIGADIFTGNNTGLFGQFESNDRFFIQLEYGF